MKISEYGEMLWDAIFNKQPEPMLCPDCGHKLQWIPVEKPIEYQFLKPIEYWGCMKCILKRPQKFKEFESDALLYWYRQELNEPEPGSYVFWAELMN